MAFAIAAFPASSQPLSPGQAAADEFIRQQARERELRLQQERTPDARLPAPVTLPGPERIPAGETPCVGINAIRLIGDSADRFQWTLAHANRTSEGEPDVATGRCLGSAGMNLVMRRIQNALVAQGFVGARVLAGPQPSFAESTLELTLFPGRIRRVAFAPGTDARATHWNAFPAQPGALLNLRDLEQALENLRRVPTVEADIQVVAAEGDDAKPGESDIVLRWQQRLPLRASLSADDSGTRATGKYQANVTLSYDNWWTLNDLLYVSLNHHLGGASSERGTAGHTLHYSVPMDYWLLGVTASTSRYNMTVPGASQTYVYSGESRNAEIKVSRLAYRDAVRKTTLSVRGWFRSSRNAIDDTEIEVQRRRMAGIDLGVSHREYLGAAALDLSLNHRQGTGAFGSLAAPEEAFGEGTSRPRIVTADAQLNAPFRAGGASFRYTGSWRAQWNRTPLVPQDRFSIGGRHTVRGFDGESTLLAERGWFLRNDIGWAWGEGQELYLGADVGEVGGASSETLVGRRLSGAVIGLRGAAKGFTYDIFSGAPLSRPPGFRTARRVAGFSATWSL